MCREPGPDTSQRDYAVATTKNSYAGWNALLTSALNSLASAAAYQSAVVDNTTNLYLDYLVAGSFATASGSLGTNPGVYVWVSGLAYNDGTNDHYGGSYNGSSDLIGGGAGSFTMPSNTGNLKLAAFVPINDAAANEVMEPFSVAALFNGLMPTKFVIIVQNSTGLALASSAGGVIYTNGQDTTTA
jgi:hypothetical protein